MPHDRALDIVVFGATGFTGGLVADYLAKQAAQSGTLRWALAGRDRAKLERVQKRLGGRASAPEILIADARDDKALREMAQKTRVVLTTVGPYLHHGEPLVRACAEEGTHYVDLTGEPTFVDRIHARYHTHAAENRAKIVNACGFDSIPHDLGAYFTLQALRARMSESERARSAVSIEAVVRAKGTISGGTWHSALEIMSSLRESIATQKRMLEQEVPGGRRVQPQAALITFRRELGLWVVPMPSIDPLVVLASARLLPEYGPDFRYGHFLGLKHLYQVSGLLTGVGMLTALAQLAPARALLRKLKPSGDGPDAATREKSWFRVIFTGSAGTHVVRCEVRGGDPGYGETAKMISEAALTLALDEDKLPAHFGVVTPAAAMGSTLIDRLVRAGIKFEEQPASAGRGTARAPKPQPGLAEAE